MQVLVAFLIVSVLIGGTRLGKPLRRHDALLLTFCTAVAASFYMLRVVL